MGGWGGGDTKRIQKWKEGDTESVREGTRMKARQKGMDPKGGGGGWGGGVKW